MGVVIERGTALLPLLMTALGWVAAVVVLGAYGLLMSGRATPTRIRYLGLNLLGSAGMAASMLTVHAWQSAAVNAIWLVFCVGPLVRRLSQRTRKQRARRRTRSPRVLSCAARTVRSSARSTHVVHRRSPVPAESDGSSADRRI